MQTVMPDYYASFTCLKGGCRHNCCIGWEIDIDENTWQFYRRVPAPFGERLRRGISNSGEPHFLLDQHKRCPFLNGEGLCDIILTLGEDALCDICADHPRFRNELPDRVEIGLGLACEAAGQLILGRQQPMTLQGESDTDDEILLLRNRLLAVLQDRTLPLSERLSQLLACANATLPCTDMGRWADVLLELERLDENWTQLLMQLREKWQRLDLEAFGHLMAARQTEYEQFAVYLLYRHFANASTLEDAAPRAAFVAWGVTLLYYLGALRYSQQGTFDFEDQVELARLFSAELEYSDENLSILWDEYL